MRKSLSRKCYIMSVAHWAAERFFLILSLHGIGIAIRIRQSCHTGTAYLKLKVFGPDGRKIPELGACVRIADHSERESRWANFSRHALRFYGVWCFSSRHKILRKIERIAYRIHLRYAVVLGAKGGAV